jgi:hypothetical protein
VLGSLGFVWLTLPVGEPDFEVDFEVDFELDFFAAVTPAATPMIINPTSATTTPITCRNMIQISQHIINKLVCILTIRFDRILRACCCSNKRPSYEPYAWSFGVVPDMNGAVGSVASVRE